MSRKCWTCQGEHDLDKPCKTSPRARSVMAAGGSDDLFDEAPARRVAISALFESVCAECFYSIFEGDRIVNDGGDWVHEGCAS